MSQAQDREILRRLEMISRIRPSDESTARAMDKARQALLEAAQAPITPDEQPSRTRYIQFKPLTFAAIAAMVISVLSIGIVAWKQSVQPKTPEIASRQTVQMEINPNIANTQRLKLEASLINSLAKLADTEALLDLLDTALPASQQLIAQQLGRLADETAIPVLSQYAVKWSGIPTANPYTQAINQIQQRNTLLAAKTTNDTVEPVTQTATGPELTLHTDKTGPVFLQGQITDQNTGNPIAGALISISGSKPLQTLSDAQGMYSFHGLEKPGYYRMKVMAKGYLGITSFKDMPLVNLKESTPLTQDLQLEKGCVIQITIHDQYGQPVKDASLTASWLGSDYDNIVGQQVVTDTDGQSLVGALEASEIEYMVTAMHPDFVPQHASVKCSDPYTDQSIDLTLHRGQTIHAFAEYADHIPAQGVTIIARPDWWRSTMEPQSQVVAEDGTFRFTSILPQTYRLFARFPQLDGSSYEIEVAQRQLPLPQGDLLFLTLPQFSPPEMETLSGNIQWAGNMKPDHVIVMAFPSKTPDTTSSNSAQYLQTILEGDLDTFEIANLTEGSYKLLFMGTNIKTKLTEEVSTSDEPIQVTLEYVATPTLSGSVVTADSGYGITDFSIALIKQVRVDNILMNRDKRLIRMTNAEEGRFHVELPGVGTYQALIQSEGYVPVVKTLEITGNDRALIVDLQEGGNIIGHVTDIQGSAISDAIITATSQFSDSIPVQDVTRNGDFFLTTIPEGMTTLRISHPEHGELVLKDLDIINGITLDLSNIMLNRGATIQGYVLDNSGLPVPSETIIVEDGSKASPVQRLATVMTDENGYYQISGLPSDLCYIYRRNPSTHTGVVRRSLIGMKDVTYDLDFGVGPQVTGFLADEQGFAVPNTRLLLSHPDSPASLLFQSYAQTDSNGLFTFAGVPCGQYAIYRQYPGNSEWIQVTTFNMIDDDLDLGVIPPNTINLYVSLLSNSDIVTSGWKLMLQKGQELWSPFIKQIDRPETGDSRFLVSDILPGDYCIVAQKDDGSQWIRTPITLLPNGSNLSLAVELPEGDISLSGTINTSQNDLILCNLDKTLVMPILNQDGQYTLNHVPAGEYFISNAVLGDMTPLEVVTLTPDTRSLQLPIDTKQWFSGGQGLISIQVSGQDGLPLMSAETQLSNDSITLTPLLRTDSELLFVAPIGTYKLTVIHDGFKSHEEEVTVESNPQIALYPERPVISVRLNTNKTH